MRLIAEISRLFSLVTRKMKLVDCEELKNEDACPAEDFTLNPISPSCPVFLSRTSNEMSDFSQFPAWTLSRPRKLRMPRPPFTAKVASLLVFVALIKHLHALDTRWSDHVSSTSPPSPSRYTVLPRWSILKVDVFLPLLKIIPSAMRNAPLMRLPSSPWTGIRPPPRGIFKATSISAHSPRFPVGSAARTLRRRPTPLPTAFFPPRLFDNLTVWAFSRYRQLSGPPLGRRVRQPSFRVVAWLAHWRRGIRSPQATPSSACPARRLAG